MKKLILVRHATTKPLETGDIGTRERDECLSEVGLVQAQALAKRLSRIQFDALYSSPLPRALATARAITGEPVVVDDLEDWREGETHLEMYARITKFVGSLDGINIIVSHGSPIAMALSHCVYGAIAMALSRYVFGAILRQAAWGITPASISVIEDGVILAVNDTAHLGIRPEVTSYDPLTWTYRK